LSHPVLPSLGKFGALQSVSQLVLPSEGEYAPSDTVEQPTQYSLDEPPTEEEGSSDSDSDRSGPNVPRGQLRQSEIAAAAVPSPYFPARQSKQVDPRLAPRVELHFPTPHARHTRGEAEPAPEVLYRPAAQGAQASDEEAAEPVFGL